MSDAIAMCTMCGASYAPKNRWMHPERNEAGSVDKWRDADGVNHESREAELLSFVRSCGPSGCSKNRLETDLKSEALGVKMIRALAEKLVGDQRLLLVKRAGRGGGDAYVTPEFRSAAAAVGRPRPHHRVVGSTSRPMRGGA